MFQRRLAAIAIFDLLIRFRDYWNNFYILSITEPRALNIEFEDFHEDYFYKEDFYDYENEYNETIEDHKNVSHNVEERQTTPENVRLDPLYP